MSIVEQISGDNTLRINWSQSYDLPQAGRADTSLDPIAQATGLPSPQLYVAGGSALIGGTYQPSAGGFITTGQGAGNLGGPYVYVDPTIGYVQAGPTLPTGCLPVALVTIDARIKVIRAISDIRPRTTAVGQTVTEKIVDTTRRVFYAQSYALPQVPQSYGFTVPANGVFPCGDQLFIAPGNVLLNGITTVPWAGGYVKPRTVGLSTGLVAVYLDGNTGNIAMTPVTAINASVFPGGSIPLAIVTLDGGGVIRDIQDYRPS